MEKKILSPNQYLIDKQNMQITENKTDEQKSDSVKSKTNIFDFDNDGVPDSAEPERRVVDIPLSMDAARDAKNAKIFGDSRGRFVDNDGIGEQKTLPDNLIHDFSEEEDTNNYDFD